MVISSSFHLPFVNVKAVKMHDTFEGEVAMRNIKFLSAFLLLGMIHWTTQAHALVLQGSIESPYPYSSPYPSVVSQAIDILPPGFITITVDDETYYYCRGIFYQRIMRDQKYVVVPPPIGAIVFTIPQGYQYMFIDGISYYVYEGVYYVRVLDGYKVISPPA